VAAAAASDQRAAGNKERRRRKPGAAAPRNLLQQRNPNTSAKAADRISSAAPNARKMAIAARRQLRRRERQVRAEESSPQRPSHQPESAAAERATLDDGSWRQRQEQTFLLWVRATISSGGQSPPANGSLVEALADGTALCDLICALTGAPPPAGMRRAATSRVHAIENANLALATLEDSGIDVGSDVCAEDFVDKAPVPVTGFVWLLFQRFVGKLSESLLHKTEQMASLREQQATAERRADAAQAEATALRRQLQQLRAAAPVDDCVNNLRMELEQQTKALQMVKSELADVCDECEAMDAQLTAQLRLAEQLQSEKEQNNTLGEALDRAQTEVSELRAELETCRTGCQVAVDAYSSAAKESAESAQDSEKDAEEARCRETKALEKVRQISILAKQQEQELQELRQQLEEQHELHDERQQQQVQQQEQQMQAEQVRQMEQKKAAVFSTHTTEDSFKAFAFAERELRMQAEASASAWRAEASAGLDHLAAAYGTGRGDALLGVQCVGWLER